MSEALVRKVYRDCKAYKGLLFKEHRDYREHRDPEPRAYKDCKVYRAIVGLLDQLVHKVFKVLQYKESRVAKVFKAYKV